GRELTPIDVDDVRGDERGGAFDDVDAEVAELLRIVVVADVAAPRAHRLHDRARRDARPRRLEPELLGVAHLMEQLRRGDERLRRHAAGPEAVAAERRAVDQRDAAPQARAAGGGDEAGGAAADDDHIVAVSGQRLAVRSG